MIALNKFIKRFTVQNPDQLYILVSPALLATHHNITDTKLLGTMFYTKSINKNKFIKVTPVYHLPEP